MKTVLIDGKEYKLEYSFEAANQTDFVTKTFKMMSGITMADGGIVEGVSSMVGMLSNLCTVGFHAALVEHHQVDRKVAYELMKTYMKDHKLNFYTLWEELKALMEEDDFLSLTGVNAMMESMMKETTEIADTLTEIPQETTKKKSTTKK